jgi:hypothetical protein
MDFEFKPRNIGKSDCDGPVIGIPHPDFDYMHRSTTGDDEYPNDPLFKACPRYLQVNGKFDNLQVTANINATGTITAPRFRGSINVQSWKGFDIQHPNKPNHRLRHICLEGPEGGVYFRGRLTNSSIIEVPDYWIGLIDPETITVSLTQIGSSQDLIVERIEWGKRIVIKSGSGTNIDCYYLIHAARIDGDPLIVEYEGNTPADYPGSDRQYSISGHDYGRKD